MTLIIVVLFLQLALAFGSEAGCQVPLKDGKCLWTSFRFEDGFTFTEARKFCAKFGDKLAQIPDEDAYDALTEHIRSEIPEWLYSVDAWIALELDPLTGTITKPDASAFTKWDPEEGLSTGVTYWEWTNVYLQVDTDEDNDDQGMVNYRPNRRMDGVVCQSAP